MSATKAGALKKITAAKADEAAPRQASFFRRNWLLLALSALCNVPAVARVEYIPAIVSIALIATVVLRASSGKQAFGAGLAYMALSGLLLDYWMVPVVTAFSGSVWIGIACYLASWTLLALCFALQFWLFYLLRVPDRRAGASWRNPLLFASVWVLFECARASFFSAVPWMGYSWGSSFASSTWLIQPAAWGGVYLLTFLMVVPAGFLAAGFYARNWRRALPAPVLLAAHALAGCLLYNAATDAGEGGPTFRAAIVHPAIPSEVAWDPAHTNELVHRLLDLNKNAVALHPDLVVWTENTVPWSYRPDDDFVKAMLKSTVGTATHTLIGMTTDGATKKDALNTSVYLLSASGTVEGRYDKQELLAGAERPLPGGVSIPFGGASSASFAPGRAALLASPLGKAGVLLCNEATIPAQAAARARAGAEWMAVVGNDAWFADTYIPLDHFYQCRLRAVENRKDLIVNMNMGFSGLVRANGAIEEQASAPEEEIRMVNVRPQSGHGANGIFLQVLVLILFASLNRFVHFTIKPKNV